MLHFAPFVLAAAVYLTVFLVMRPLSAGDEPHYMLAAESIAYDFDLDLRNDYASEERTRRIAHFFPLEPPHAMVYPPSDALRPVRTVGLPALLAGPVAAGGSTGARLAMIAIAALLAHQLFGLLADLFPGRRRLRWPAWAAVVFCLPLVAFSNQVYPEVPGALIVVVAARAMLRPGGGIARLAVAGVASALLPWLHVRFLPLALVLTTGLAYAACRRSAEAVSWAAGRRAALRRWLGGSLRRERRAVAAAVAPLVVSLVGLAGSFEYWYGSPSPRAGYRPIFEGTVGSGGWTFWYEYFLGDVLHPGYGWLPYVPVHWLGLAGLGCLVLVLGRHAVVALAAAAAYVLFVASTGLPLGFSFPGRILLVVIVLVAVPLVVVLERVRLARLLFYPLLLGSLVFAAAGVLHHDNLYPSLGDRWVAQLAGVRSIQTAFPDLRPASPPTRLGIEAPDATSDTGRLEGDRLVASDERGDRAGYLARSVVFPLRSGEYEAVFDLAVEGRGANARLEVDTVYGGPPTGPDVATKDVDVPGEAALPFAARDATLLEVRVFYGGRGAVELGGIFLVRTSPIPPAQRFPDWPLAFLWVVGTVLVGALFVQVARRDGDGTSKELQSPLLHSHARTRRRSSAVRAADS